MYSLLLIQWIIQLLYTYSSTYLSDKQSSSCFYSQNVKINTKMWFVSTQKEHFFYSHSLYWNFLVFILCWLKRIDQLQKQLFLTDEPQQLTHLKNLLTSTLLHKREFRKEFCRAYWRQLNNFTIWKFFTCNPVEHLESIAKVFSGIWKA